MQNRLVQCVLSGLALVLAMASPAAAQSSKPAAASPGLMVRGLGGVTFTGVTGGIFSGAVGMGVGRHVVIFGEVGRMTGVVPKSIQDFIDNLLQDPELTGSTVDFSVKFPATYYLGGVRFVIKTKGSVQPFIEGGAGLAHLTVSTRLKVDGEDFTQELRDFLVEIGVPLSANQLLLMIGGGVTCRLAPHINLDAGYRLMYIATEDPSLKTNAVYAAVTWRR